MSKDSKERVSLTLDPDVAQYLRTKDNKSGYVNRLLRDDMNGETIDVKLLSMRREMVAGQLEEMKSRQEAKEAELAEIEARLERYENSKQSILDRAAETLRPQQLNEDNLAVERWAEKADMDEYELIQAVEQRMDRSAKEYYE